MLIACRQEVNCADPCAHCFGFLRGLRAIWPRLGDQNEAACICASAPSAPSSALLMEPDYQGCG